MNINNKNRLNLVRFFSDAVLGHEFVKLSGGDACVLGGFLDFTLVPGNQVL